MKRGTPESALSAGGTVHPILLIQEPAVPNRPTLEEPARSRRVVQKVRRTMLAFAIRNVGRATKESDQFVGVSVLQDSPTLEPSVRSQPPMGEAPGS